MGASTAQLQSSYGQKRRELDLLRASLDNEVQSFLPHWKSLGNVYLPRRPRFELTDTNRGDRRNTEIIDSTATFALRTLQSGMMSGVTSPARPWFRLTVSDYELAELGSVKDWLHDSTERMRAVFADSNLYKVLPIIYGDMGAFGTAAMLIEDDPVKVVRFKALPIGSYRISVNERGKVDTFFREFRMTVRQLVSMFGYDHPGEKEPHWERFSTHVKDHWENGRLEEWIDVCHVIRPNPDFRPSRALSRYKRFESLYYERGKNQYHDASYTEDADRYLREMGYDYFPVLCPRWMVNAEDSYATDCPGMMAYGDTRALQVLQKLKGNLVEKSAKPPMVGPPALKNARISHIPGDISFSIEREGQKGLRPMYEVNPGVLNPVLEDIAAHQRRIKTAFFEDLFLMLANDERTQPPTAEEIIERRSEKMIAIGPVLEQLNEDVFDDLIDITFYKMLDREMIPEPPQVLRGKPLKVEYVSIMSQAQKLVGLSTIERFIGFTHRLAAETKDLTVLDKVDRDQAIDEYGSALGVSSRIIRPDDEVDRIRAQRAKDMKAQQDAALAAEHAQTAKTLSETDLENNNGLTRMIELSQAGNPVPN